jgi:serine/threonine protein kinase
MATQALPRHADLVGQTIDPGYRLVALLDAGGFNAVYRAWDHAVDRYVAVKVAGPHADGIRPEDLQRRMRAFDWQPLPQVVPALASGSHQGLPYVVLPYLAGGTLLLRRPSENGRPLRAHPALLHGWLPKVAQALDALHDQGLVHGAVSPGTILFDHDGEPWLADFRLAAAFRATAAEPSASPPLPDHDLTARRHYLCPQRLHGLALTPASDQFALSAVVYEFLATTVPFEGATMAEVAASQAAHAAEPLRTMSPTLPETLADAVHRGLAHASRDRHETCGAFASRVLAEIPTRDISRKTRLICPACRRLIPVNPEAAGREGTCLTCHAPVVVDSDLRWLVFDADRRAPSPPIDRSRAPRRWLWPSVAAASVTAALAIATLRGPDEPEGVDGPAPATAPADAIAARAPSLPPAVPPADAPVADPAADEGDAVAEAPPPPKNAGDAEPLPSDPPERAPAPAAVDPAPAPAPDAVVLVPPPAVPPRPAPAARPAAIDIAGDRLREELEPLHASRKQLLVDRKAQKQLIVEKQTLVLNLAKEWAAKQAEHADASRMHETLVAQQLVAPVPERVPQINQIDAKRKILHDRLMEIGQETEGAKAAAVSAEGAIKEIQQDGERLRQTWIARLNPLERDSLLDVKIEALSAEILDSPDFPECHLYRAMLFILAGNIDDARADLAIVDDTLIKGPEPVLPSTAIDYVYANLMVGDGLAARRCLAVAQKHAPNDPILQHVQALCEIAENNYTKASQLFRAALRTTKNRRQRERALLCSDAAWLFAAAPNDQVRNAKLAEENAAEAIATGSAKAWQAWRARAVLAADEQDWLAAEQSLEKAAATVPLVLADELESHESAIAARKPYRIARK